MVELAVSEDTVAHHTIALVPEITLVPTVKMVS